MNASWIEHLKIDQCNSHNYLSEKEKLYDHSVGAGKAFNKINHPLMMKTLKNLGKKWKFFNLMKGFLKNLQLILYLMMKD